MKVLHTFDNLLQDGYDPAVIEKIKKVDPCPNLLFG
jgi:hypothetical protein